MNPPPSPDSENDPFKPRPAPGSPDLSKIGFGALGGVHVEHNPVYSETHVHNHPPSAPETGSRLWVKMVAAAPISLVAYFIFHQTTVVKVETTVKGNEVTIGNNGSQVIGGGQAVVGGGSNGGGDAPAPKPQPQPAPAPAPAPAPVPALPVAVPTALDIKFDRRDRVYYDGDTQAVRVTVPRAGYLYIASVWANGQMRLLCHPDWLKPVPGPVTAGQIIDVPTVVMKYTPANPADLYADEEVRAILSDTPIPSLRPDRHADISSAWHDLGFTVQAPAVRYRGGELPDPAFTTSPAGLVEGVAPYRMRQKNQGL